MQQLREYLQRLLRWLENDWRKKRAEKQRRNTFRRENRYEN